MRTPQACCLNGDRVFWSFFLIFQGLVVCMQPASVALTDWSLSGLEEYIDCWRVCVDAADAIIIELG